MFLLPLMIGDNASELKTKRTMSCHDNGDAKLISTCHFAHIIIIISLNINWSNSPGTFASASVQGSYPRTPTFVAVILAEWASLLGIVNVNSDDKRFADTEGGTLN